MFRRKQDEEDPFAALKDAAERGSARVSTGNAAATASTGRSSEESGGSGDSNVASSQISGVPGSDRARRGSNAFLVLLTIVIALGAAAGLVLLAEGDPPSGAAADGDAQVSGEPGSSDGDSEPGTTTDGPAPPKQYDLVGAAGFRKALGAVQRQLKSGERVWLIRVARDRINISTRLRNGDQRQINVDDELHVDASTAGSAGDRAGLPLGRIDAQAPSRAVRRAAASARTSPRRLDYLVLFSSSFPGDAPTWSIFFKNGSQTNTQMSASLDGRTVHRPGEAPISDSGASGSASNSVTIRTDRGTTTLTGAAAQRVMDCVRRARTDGKAITECLP